MGTWRPKTTPYNVAIVN